MYKPFIALLGFCTAPYWQVASQFEQYIHTFMARKHGTPVFYNEINVLGSSQTVVKWVYEMNARTRKLNTRAEIKCKMVGPLTTLKYPHTSPNIFHLFFLSLFICKYILATISSQSNSLWKAKYLFFTKLDRMQYTFQFPCIYRNIYSRACSISPKNTWKIWLSNSFPKWLRC